MIAGLRDEGITVFLTTHYLEEAERLCDRVAMMVHGRIVALDTVSGLRAQTGGFTGIEVTLAGHNGATMPEIRRLTGDSVENLIVQAIAGAQAEERQIVALNTVRPSLEDVFVELTGLNVDAMRIEKNGKGK
jgi:ABC-2 type transport system ATP-binding protein